MKPNSKKEIDHSLFLNGYYRLVNNDLVGAGIDQKPFDAEAVTLLAFKSRKIEGCMSTQTYNIQEAKAHFTRLLQEAASGVKVTQFSFSCSCPLSLWHHTGLADPARSHFSLPE